MAEQTQERTSKKGTPNDKFQAEFAALPLDEKFANLLKMEAATLSEAFDYTVKSVGAVLTDISTRIETEVKKATSTAEDYTPPKAASADEPKPKAAPKRKAPPKPKA